MNTQNTIPEAPSPLNSPKSGSAIPKAPSAPGIQKSKSIKLLAVLVFIFSIPKILMLITDFQYIILSPSIFSFTPFISILAAYLVLFSQNVTLYKISRIIILIWVISPIFMILGFFFGMSTGFRFF